ncbi:MAG: cytochrome b/b6 domain-containing protein [Xanthobacteraceae bacterium]
MPDSRVIYRQRLWVRVAHWINVVCMTALLMSGLQIFNARPDLYWGTKSVWHNPLVTIGTAQDAKGETIGTTRIGSHTFNTTGLLGYSGGMARAFPFWATLPGVQWLAMARRWHFFFAWIFVINGAIYFVLTFLTRHLRGDLWPTRSDLAHIGRSIRDHMRLRFPHGEAAKRYNVLQKLSYLAVILVLAPLMIFTGLTLSPRLDASFPFLLDVFGGRQSARTIHFFCAFALLAFVAVHIALVLLSGVFNNMRSMTTGWYKIRGGNEIG